jgi:hypothetical protein
VLNGRFGPYISDGKLNGKIPKDRDPASLTLAEVQQMMEETGKPARKGFGAKKAATKTAVKKEAAEEARGQEGPGQQSGRQEGRREKGREENRGEENRVHLIPRSTRRPADAHAGAGRWRDNHAFPCRCAPPGHLPADVRHPEPVPDRGRRRPAPRRPRGRPHRSRLGPELQSAR